MDTALITRYEEELRYLREAGERFAAERPDIASKLGLKESPCQDPYVERLLEGFAFLSARMQVRLDTSFARFTQALLSVVFPHYLLPTPSMCIASFLPELTDAGLAEGFPIRRGALLRGELARGESTPCTFTTGSDLVLWPLEIAETEYHYTGLGRLDLPPDLDAKSALRLRLKATAGLTFDKLATRSLVFYIGGDKVTANRLYEEIFANVTAVVVQGPERRGRRQVRLARTCVQQVGFGAGEALLPVDDRSFHGYRLLREYFAFPDRFLFLEVGGLQEAFAQQPLDTVDLILCMRHAEPALERTPLKDCLRLNCVPAINLFPKRTDRVNVSRTQADFRVVVDRMRPLDYEIVRIEDVLGYSSKAVPPRPFRPFYQVMESDNRQLGAYYVAHRAPRALSDHELTRGTLRSYRGSEVSLSLVDGQAAPFSADLRELAVSVLCSNRALPLDMPVNGTWDFRMDDNAPLRGIVCACAPTDPLPSPAEGSLDWQTISHLALSYFSLADTQGGESTPALRQMLSLYKTSSAAHDLLVDGLLLVKGQSAVRRVRGMVPQAFARGVEISLKFKEDAFRGSGLFLLGAVLERFFAAYASVNSFTETHVSTDTRGEIMRWPARCGMQTLL